MEKYIPDIYQKNIYTIDYDKLLNRNIKCLLFDLDNTIVPSNCKEVPKKAKELFASLKQKGFNIIIFTNSPMFRLKIFKEALNVEGCSSAHKPHTKKLKKILGKYNYDISEVAIIGDQMMTDILVGNKVGITTILINQVSKKDFILTRINRHFEKKIQKKLKDKDLFRKEHFYD